MIVVQAWKNELEEIKNSQHHGSPPNLQGRPSQNSQMKDSQVDRDQLTGHHCSRKTAAIDDEVAKDKSHISSISQNIPILAESDAQSADLGLPLSLSIEPFWSKFGAV